MSRSCLLQLRVSPGASRSRISGWHAQSLKCSVTAVAENGKANLAVIKLLAKALGLPRSGLSIVRGHSQRDKLLRVAMAADELTHQLQAPSGAVTPEAD